MWSVHATSSREGDVVDMQDIYSQENVRRFELFLLSLYLRKKKTGVSDV